MDQLALGLIIALVPLILAGLSIATFMQPRVARKALIVLIILNVIYFFGVYTAEMGAKQGYSNSLEAVANDTLITYNPLEGWSAAKMDSIKIYLEVRSAINNQIYENVLKQQQDDLKYTQSIRMYCYISLATFVVFLILTYLFETMKFGEKLNEKTKAFDLTKFNRH